MKFKKAVADIIKWVLKKSFNSSMKDFLTGTVKDLYKQTARDEFTIKSELIRVKKGEKEVVEPTTFVIEKETSGPVVIQREGDQEVRRIKARNMSHAEAIRRSLVEAFWGIDGTIINQLCGI